MEIRTQPLPITPTSAPSAPSPPPRKAVRFGNIVGSECADALTYTESSLSRGCPMMLARMPDEERRHPIAFPRMAPLSSPSPAAELAAANRAAKAVDRAARAELAMASCTRLLRPTFGMAAVFGSWCNIIQRRKLRESRELTIAAGRAAAASAARRHLHLRIIQSWQGWAAERVVRMQAAARSSSNHLRADAFAKARGFHRRRLPRVTSPRLCEIFSAWRAVERSLQPEVGRLRLSRRERSLQPEVGWLDTVVLRSSTSGKPQHPTRPCSPRPTSGPELNLSDASVPFLLADGGFWRGWLNRRPTPSSPPEQSKLPSAMPPSSQRPPQPSQQPPPPPQQPLAPSGEELLQQHHADAAAFRGWLHSPLDSGRQEPTEQIEREWNVAPNPRRPLRLSAQLSGGEPVYSSKSDNASATLCWRTFEERASSGKSTLSLADLRLRQPPHHQQSQQEQQSSSAPASSLAPSTPHAHEGLTRHPREGASASAPGPPPSSGEAGTHTAHSTPHASQQRWTQQRPQQPTHPLPRKRRSLSSDSRSSSSSGSSASDLVYSPDSDEEEVLTLDQLRELLPPRSDRRTPGYCMQGAGDAPPGTPPMSRSRGPITTPLDMHNYEIDETSYLNSLRFLLDRDMSLDWHPMRLDEVDHHRCVVRAYRSSIRAFGARSLFHSRPLGQFTTAGSRPHPPERLMTPAGSTHRSLQERESTLLADVLSRLDLEPNALVDEAAALCGYGLGELSDLSFSEQVSALATDLGLPPPADGVITLGWSHDSDITWPDPSPDVEGWAAAAASGEFGPSFVPASSLLSASSSQPASSAEAASSSAVAASPPEAFLGGGGDAPPGTPPMTRTLEPVTTPLDSHDYEIDEAAYLSSLQFLLNRDKECSALNVQRARFTVRAYRSSIREFGARRLFHHRPLGPFATAGARPGPSDQLIAPASMEHALRLQERECTLLAEVLHHLCLDPDALVDEAAACCGYGLGELSDLEFMEQVSVLATDLGLPPPANGVVTLGWSRDADILWPDGHGACTLASDDDHAATASSRAASTAHPASSSSSLSGGGDKRRRPPPTASPPTASVQGRT